jgi:PHD/YefM family antitoxin component YafN of YafNO toxin-antitoxin module
MISIVCFQKGDCEMPQIMPIKDLKNTSEISDICHKSEEPIYITKNGYGDMVIMSMEVYQSIMQKVEVYKDVEVSELQIEAGQVREARDALADMREKYGI